jgi:hypothetical protein
MGVTSGLGLEDQAVPAPACFDPQSPNVGNMTQATALGPYGTVGQTQE